MINGSMALVLFAAAATCCVLAGWLMVAMIGEINGRVPNDQRISYLGGHFEKYVRILREHRRLYPSSTLPRLYGILLALATVLGAASAWQFGFF